MSTDHTVIRVDGTRTTLESGALVPRLTSPGEISLLASRALLLGGDSLRLTVEVAAGSRLLLRDVAAMVAYNGKGNSSAYDVTISVGPDAVLIWDAQPLIVSDGATVRRTLVADCDSGGRLLMRDSVVLGRTGQRGGRLECRTRIGYAHRPAVAEDLDLPDPGPGITGGRRILETITAIGWRPVAAHAYRFDLSEPGVIERDLVTDQHRSRAAQSWRDWRLELSRYSEAG